MGGTVFWGEIEENVENICGVIDYDKHAFFITCTEDEPVDREYTLHQIYDDKAPDTVMHMLVARHDKASDRKNTAIHRIVKILEMTKGRSVHFPKIICYGRLRKMIFGENGDQDAERDPEWIGRPCAILEYHATVVGSLLSLSPTGTVPLDLALVIMMGCVRALASLHRLGYVHRQVSPYSFAYRNPISYDSVESRILIIDLSLALPWPCKPRIYVPFVGTIRYSSVRAHRGREQGPSDDIISLIYMIAELISGKLPWRSVFDEKRVCDMKCLFYRTIEFKRLPREIRSLYRLMYMTLSPYPIDYKFIIEQIQAALNRRYPNYKHELPSWLALPIAEE
ncbi:CK1/TTBK protein kinase [Loa loa]|uniref:CK1/TTBK protein kinase n=1 Tax=Loa loa TaxID=7209 RepID=A0A1I7W5S7_LOALO|nr:CK1/TTBK protein kinase [Loa loa]EFO21989.1 CK1/TTBK protein kinase [Loa loa]